MIILVVTIIVALILISVITISTANAMNLANLLVFSKNLTEIQDSTNNYYISNNVMPELESSRILSKDELLEITTNIDILLEELTENNDLDSVFYTIDLKKINVTKIAYGNKQLGENDIFVISYPLMNVYYPYGIYANNTTYFSLTSRITDALKPSQIDIYDPISTLPVINTIKVSQNVGWTNNMNIYLEVDMQDIEELYMSVSGGTNRRITTTVGNNMFNFNSLSSIVSDTETIKVPTLTLEEANYIDLSTKPISERYIDILKYRNNVVIETKRIDLSNFDKISPTIVNATITSYLTQNKVELLLNSVNSDIKEIRYEYLTRYRENGIIDNYYANVSDFDYIYMHGRGKTSEISNDFITTIYAPKNVQSIKIMIIDKAGNVSLYNQEIAPRLYIGYFLDSYTLENLQLTSKVYSVNGVKSISFSKSIDGINYTDEQIYLLNTTDSITTKQSLPYIDINQEIVYIKIVAVNLDNTLVETRILRINLTEPIIDLPYTTTKPQLSDVDKYTKPYVPTGFTYKEGTWDTGLVIEDNVNNEFVWVPVDGTDVKYEKWTEQGYTYNNVGITDDTLPLGITSETSQITNYGGFYIARYEAGKEGASTVVSKKNVQVWQSINYTNAKVAAESMYITSSVNSGLVTGTQWDTTMKWIQNSSKSVIDGRSWGNYKDSVSPANVTGYKKLQPTGYSEFWKANNIYDLAGNILEWSNEIYQGGSSITRGGFHGDNGSIYGSSFRGRQGLGYQNNKLGFRCVLYLK